MSLTPTLDMVSRCKNCVTRNAIEGGLFCVVCDISNQGAIAELCALNLHYKNIPAGECRGVRENCQNKYCPRTAEEAQT